MKAKLLIIICLLMTSLNGFFAQIPVQDSILVDSTSVLLDSIIGTFNVNPDTSEVDLVNISSSAPDAGIDYESRDSMIYDIENQKIFLYGGAKITYTQIVLEADYIEFDWGSNVVYATGLPDSLGKMAGQPDFSDGDQAFQSSEMRYNFKTGKGIVYDAATVQNELYVLGERAKFISAQDTLHTDVIYSKRAIFTTCNHPHPHFGIRSTKQKVVPNKVAVVGPSNLEIMGVPTPLWLPFGFFPLSQTRSTGLIFPRGYEYNESTGFGLRNVGWYFPFGETVDLQLTGDFYVKGTFRIRSTVNYAKRYKYRGDFMLEYGRLRTENLSTGALEPSQNFSFILSHNQDAKAHPSRTIGGNIRIQTNDALAQNYNDANSQLSTNLSSGFSYRESFPGKPYNLSAGLTHSQNTRTREVVINFPDFRFQTQSLYPFRFKSSSGNNPTWYEKIALTYKGEAKSTLVATDTTLFTQEALDGIQYGAKHTVDLNTNLKLFKYFNITPSVDYSEVWYFQSLDTYFDPTTMEVVDTIINSEGVEEIRVVETLYGQVKDSVQTGFIPLRQFDMGTSIDTKLFGTVLFNKGLIRGYRHQMTPSLGLSFAPDYTSSNFDYFQDVQIDSRFPSDSTETFNRFRDGIYGRPSDAGQQLLLTYGLRNILETKLYSKTDSTTRNVKVLQRFDFRGNYNFAAEEFKWSRLSLSANTSLFKGVTNITFSASFDPYKENTEGKRIEEFVWSDRKIPVRFTNANMRITTTLTVAKIRSLFGKGNKDIPDERPSTNTSNGILDLFENFSINHTLVFDRQQQNNVDTFQITTNTIYLNGRIDLTDKWRVTVGSFGYDFVNKGLTFPSLAVSRDLHCWEMGLSWQPTLNTYAFFLRVDSGSFLDFLNIPYRKGSQDPFFSTTGSGFSGF